MTNKLYFTVGKGGVGKTYVSLLLAKHLATKGLNTLIVECNGAQQIPQMLGIAPQRYTIQPLLTNVSSISITPMEAIEDYLVQQLKFKKVFNVIFQHKLTQPLLEGAPGLHDAAQLGKIYDLAIHRSQGKYTFDAIIVDTPSTGHGITLLSSAQTMMNVTKIGPIYENNKLVEAVVSERSELLLVTVPEELPCLESLYLFNAVRSDFQAKFSMLFVNKIKDLPLHLRHQHALTQPPWSERLPEYALQLSRWQQEVQQQSKWLDWLQLKIPLPIAKLTIDKHQTMTFPPDAAHCWEER